MRVIATLALTVVGCASIQSIETTTDTPVSPSVRHGVLRDSLEYTANISLEGYTISVEIAQSETCETVTTRRVHRKRYVDRRVDSIASRTTWGIAIGGLLSGGYSYFDADRLAANATVKESNNPDDYRMYGTGLLALGALAAVIGTIDALRASDSAYDDGIIKGRSSRERDTCRQGKTRDQLVSLKLPNGHELEARTDTHGSVSFSLLPVPEESLPTATRDTHVVVGGESIALSIPPHERALLHASLRANPRSRVAMDILAKRQQECTNGVTAARSLVTHEHEVAATDRDAWLAAKSSCGDLWTTALEEELVEIHRRYEYTVCSSRLVDAASAFVDDSGVTVGEMSIELQSIRDTCTSPRHLAQVRQLEAKLVAAIKRNEAAERRAARQEAAERRREIERARARRSFPDPEPAWSTPTRSRACCKVCSAGKACGNSCIARWKTCHKGVGCACDG